MKWTDETIMPFGKHKGLPLKNIPASYFIFLFDGDKCYGDLKKWISENIADLRLKDKEHKDFNESKSFKNSNAYNTFRTPLHRKY